MLMTTLKPGDKVLIGENIVIEYINTSKNKPSQIRLGIQAPRNVPVDREEVRERKAGANGT